MKILFTEEFGNLAVPERVRPYIRKYLIKAGIIKVPYAKFGAMFYTTLFLSLIILFGFINDYITPGSILKFFGYNITSNIITYFFLVLISFALTELILVGLTMFGAKFYYDLVIYKRQRKIEVILPDFLSAVSTNLKAGMTFDKALWNAIEPGYDILAKEIEIVAKKTMSGGNLEKALIEFNAKYKSSILKESIELIITGLRSGGKITDLIDKLVESIKQSVHLKKEMIAAVMNYIIFITIIAVVVSPALFALSFNLLTIIQSLGARLTSTGTVGVLPFSFGQISVKPEDFITFSRWAVGVISIFSAFIISNIRTGTWKGSVKFIPIFVGLSLIIYEISLKVLTLLFGMMF